jgi:hypothetical protein
LFSHLLSIEVCTLREYLEKIYFTIRQDAKLNGGNSNQKNDM